LHHKFGLIDDKIVITGSHNWSLAADRNNDETVLVIQSQTVAAHFKREFERLYGNAVLGVPDWMQRKIKVQQQQCPQIITASPNQGQNLSPQSQEQKVNLNTASIAELEALPGVGPKLAREIIQARQQKPFTSLEDLDKVPGVGSSKLEKLRDRVTW